MTDKPQIPNVLASRYASAELAELWSPEHKVRLERELWLAVLRAQAELGVDAVITDDIMTAWSELDRATVIREMVAA